MNVGQSFRLAIKSLLTSKARALLTMLGIIIGVAAVIVIVSLGTGMQTYMNSQFEQVGVNLIQVMVYEQPGNRNADADDFYELAEKYPQYIDSVTPALTISGIVRHGADEYERTSVTGVSETVYNPETSQTVNGEQMEDGRFLSYVDVERNQHVCVVGSYLNEAMFGGRGVGQALTIGGVPFTVIGTMAETADSTEGSGDDFIYVPYGLAPQLNGAAGGSGMSGYLVASTSEDTSSAAKGVIESMLFRIYEDSSWYQVITMAEMMDMMDSMLGVLMTILIVIAAISLVVGGIGIMNIMLVSVTERTREIGIRKSLGAKERYIMQQFVIEAASTSALGGVTGILLGDLLSVAASVVATRLMGENLSVSPTLAAVAAAFGISVGIGILFGYLPAKKAAVLNPIDALHYD